MKTLLLTGGSGMVGRNVLADPRSSSYRILAPTRSEMDLTDAPATEDYLRRSAPDLVLHAAGRVGGIQANLRHPVDFLTANLLMGVHLVRAARKAGVRSLLNLGSSCMYPREAVNPLQEETILTGELEPTNEGYALAKIAVMRLCQYLMREDESIRYKTLVPCNLYGPWDKFDPDHSHLVAAVLEKLHEAKRSGNETVEIWGHGTARREFLFVGDLVDCIYRALADMDGVPEVMNVGVGLDHTVDEYYETAARIVGYEGSFIHDTSRPVGMMRKLVSTRRAEQWGWRASTPLEDGLRRTYHYRLEIANG